MTGGIRKGPLIEPLPPSERLSDEDLATRREAELLADALAVHELRARGGDVIEAGRCSNCRQCCAPAAVYCDADCRADHEARMLRQARQRRVLG